LSTKQNHIFFNLERICWETIRPETIISAMSRDPQHSIQKPAQKTKSATEISLQLAGLGTELAAPVLLGAFFSIQFGWGIAPVLIGLFLGIAGTIAHVLVFLRRNPEMHGKESLDDKS
jgi:hypothetical protein